MTATKLYCDASPFFFSGRTFRETIYHRPIDHLLAWVARFKYGLCLFGRISAAYTMTHILGIDLSSFNVQEAVERVLCAVLLKFRANDHCKDSKRGRRD